MGKQLNWTVITSVFGISIILVLFVLRLVSNVSLITPLQLTTSGDEVSSIFAIWKYLSGQPVYVVPTEIPFTFSNFNWLFYGFFGSAAGLVMGLFNLADPWLPTVTRIITLLGSAVGVWVSYRVLIGLKVDDSVNRKRIDVVALGLALLVFVGPLAGFWAITTRPDIWTTALEATLLLGVLHFYPKSTLKAALWALVVGYITWSFKTIDITVAFGTGVFFLLRRDWLAAAVLAIGTLLLWVTTYYLGGEAYRFSLLGIHLQAGFPFLIESGMRVILNFSIKSLPVMLPILVIGWVILCEKRVRHLLYRDWQLQLLLTLGICSLSLNLIFSFKYGSAENYFFTPVLMLSFIVFKFLSDRQLKESIKHKRVRLIGFCFSIGWFLLASASISVIAGLNGVISAQKSHPRIETMQTCLGKLEPPVFVQHTYLSLPWITPGPPNFVISFHYNFDRSSGRAFEAGGIGGLIESGYFNSLVFNSPLDAFDGAPLEQYRLQPISCAGWSIYRKDAQ